MINFEDIDENTFPFKSTLDKKAYLQIRDRVVIPFMPNGLKAMKALEKIMDEEKCRIHLDFNNKCENCEYFNILAHNYISIAKATF